MKRWRNIFRILQHQRYYIRFSLFQFLLSSTEQQLTLLKIQTVLNCEVVLHYLLCSVPYCTTWSWKSYVFAL